MNPSSSSSTNPHDSPVYVPSGDARRVVRVRERHPDALDRDRAALVDRVRPAVVGDAVGGQPAAQLDLRDDGTVEALVDRHRVAEMVAVAVRQEDQVAPLGLRSSSGVFGLPLRNGST